MSAPSPRCGRLDDHEPHEWQGREDHETCRGWNYVTLRCPGHTVVEGGHPCVDCQAPLASCRCNYWRAEERRKEWDSE